MSITYIKMMNKEDKADNDASKGYRLIPVDNEKHIIDVGIAGEWSGLLCLDKEGDTKPYVCIIDRYNDLVEEVYFPEANVYLVNEYGKTVSTFAG